jgi:hypothetical protein
LINNRQGGRRRGRGGQRGSLGGQPGNRQDNRQRGNAAQLLEKYKSLARDAQLSGDRVQTEYYLQFADHYFRVLSESRARFEDQNQRRPRDDEFDEEGEEELAEAGDTEASADEQPDREVREERHERGERFGRRNRQRRGDGEERNAQAEQPEPEHVNGETIPFDVLPPAIGRDESASSGEQEPRRPRRRSRAPRPAEGDEEVAPAA